MADALCGPSNALKNFSKHSQVDRTLQQDRLLSRQPQQESFRSSPQQPNPILDAEFEAFKSGQSLVPVHNGLQNLHQPFQPAHQLHHPATFPQIPPPQQQEQQQPGPPPWAVDFQQLNIFEARQSPVPSARLRYEAPVQRSNPMGSWHGEFLRNQRSVTPIQGMDLGMGAGLGMSGLRMGATGMGTMQQNRTQTMHQQQQPQKEEVFDDAAFAAAFDSAAAMFGGSEAKGKEKARATPEAERFDLSQACVDPPEAFSTTFDDGTTDEDLFAHPFQQQQQQSSSRTRSEELQHNGLVEEVKQVVPDFSSRGAGYVVNNLDFEPFIDDPAVESQLPFLRARDLREARNNLTSGVSAQSSQQDRIASTEMETTSDHLRGFDEATAGLDFSAEESSNTPSAHAQEQRDLHDQRMEPEGEADELSRTAGELLDHLKHEQSEKFANSGFMALMRQLRDREVMVEGEKFVEVSDMRVHEHERDTPVYVEPDLGSRGEFSSRDWA